MDIKLGKLRVNLSALALYDRMSDAQVSRFLSARTAPRRFYRWDCRTQSGKPDPRPDGRRRETSLLIHVADVFGGVDQQSTQSITRDLLKAADLRNLQALDKALQAQLPPLVVPVDWAQLLDPFKAQYSLDVYEQVSYLQCLARPYGMMPEDHFFIFVPHLVTFSSRVTGRWGGTAKNGSVVTGWSPHITLKGAPEKLERQISKEEAEAAKRRKRLAKEDGPFKPMPFDHGFFKEEEDPEEDKKD
jgi:hypothetical protein